MVNKKQKLLELLGFCVILIVLIVYYAVNRNNRGQQDIAVSPVPTATAEVIVPPVVSSNTGVDNVGQAIPASEQPVEHSTRSNESVNTYNGGSNDSAKADSYYADLDNFQEEQTEDKSVTDDRPQTEIKDGIEIITNPQEGVQ